MEIANYCILSLAPAACAWNTSKLRRRGTLKNSFQISRHLRAVTKRCYRHLPPSLDIRAQAPDDENGTSPELQSDVERVEAQPSKLRYGLITGLATAGLVETTYLTWMTYLIWRTSFV